MGDLKQSKSSDRWNIYMGKKSFNLEDTVIGLMASLGNGSLRGRSWIFQRINYLAHTQERLLGQARRRTLK